MALGWRGQYLRYRDFFLNVMLVYRKRQDLKMFLEILLSLATVSFFAVFALRPTLLTIAQLLKDVKGKEETVAKMDKKIADISSAQNVFDSEKARIPLIDFSVPLSPSPEKFVRQIEGLAGTHSIKLLGTSIGEVVLVGEEKARPTNLAEAEALPENSRGLSFSVSIAGDYPSLSAFLADLEKMRRPLKIDSAGINSSKTELGKILVLVVSGRVPYLGGK